MVIRTYGRRDRGGAAGYIMICHPLTTILAQGAQSFPFGGDLNKTLQNRYFMKHLVKFLRLRYWPSHLPKTRCLIRNN